jgi:ATP:corrinoid adenosyltransferase
MGEGFTWETQDRARDVAAAVCISSSPAATQNRSFLPPPISSPRLTLVKHHFAAGVKAQPGIES